MCIFPKIFIREINPYPIFYSLAVQRFSSKIILHRTAY